MQHEGKEDIIANPFKKLSQEGLTLQRDADIIPSCQAMLGTALDDADANVAQSVEQRFRKPQVKGSSPFIGSIFSRCSAVW